MAVVTRTPVLRARESYPAAMSDGLVFALRLLGQLAWMLRDRLLGTRLARRGGIPRSVDAIDATWLSEALQQSYPGVVVNRVERLAGHSGTTVRERIALSYAKGTDGGAARSAGGRAEQSEPPRTLFVKTTPRDFSTRLFAGLLRLGRSEVDFYRGIRPDLTAPAPRCHCARSARHGGRFVLLLEDLAVTGARFPRLDDPLRLEDVREVVLTLAELHASFWDSPRLRGDLAWLKACDNNPNAAVERLISSRAHRPAIARHAGILPASLRENGHRIHEHRKLLEDYWAEGPLTLIHGDSHVGNMYFRDGRAGLFDWQVLQRGQGIRDIAYFMVNSVDVELRRAHEHELIDLYLATLAQAGVGRVGIGREEVWERYRSHALYAWISTSVTAATPGLQPPEVALRAVQRTAAALEDLRCFELLDELVASRGART